MLNPDTVKVRLWFFRDFLQSVEANAGSVTSNIPKLLSLIYKESLGNSDTIILYAR
jgi:hypothetical protein